jgi:hypothetical protein
MVTTKGAHDLLCPVCATPFTPIRRQRYCSPACRQAAWRARQPAQGPDPSADTIPRGTTRRSITIYACPECDTRYHAEQWCPDCNRPCLRIGTGGCCPNCDELLTVDELLDRDQNQPASPANPG